VSKAASGGSSERSAAVGLLAQAQKGDRRALGDLLERFRPALHDLARQLLSRDLAQKVAASDLVQETCIDAMQGFDAADVRHVGALEAWLVTLLTHNLIDWQRRFKKSQKRDVSRERPLDDDESRSFLMHAAFGGELSPESHAIGEESKNRLTEALNRLPRGYREIILWRHEQRLTWNEIAKLVDRSEDAVRMLWQRAIRRLKRELRGDQ
jgi:RNA polymerase sigma-70 factor (ECF subfamily)